MSTSKDFREIVVLGGGLSGLSAMCNLLDKGYKVTLIEKRPFLGGRAFSYIDKEAGLEVDNGQHIFMGCCTYLIEFLQKVNAYKKVFIQDRLNIKVVRNSRESSIFSTSWLGPLHLLPSLITYRHLSFKDKLLIVYALLKIKNLNREAVKHTLDKESFYNWLKRHKQTDRSIQALWNLVVLPTLNDDIRNVSAYMGIMVFQQALLKGPKEAVLGFSKVGLTSLLADSTQEYVKWKSAEIIMGKAVTSIDISSNRVNGIRLSDGTHIKGKIFISALPFDKFKEIVPISLNNHDINYVGKGLTCSPILGIHIWYDREVMQNDLVAFLDSEVQWVFNKSSIQRIQGLSGQYISVSISGAWKYANMPKQQIQEIFTRELKQLFPKARQAVVKRFIIIKQLEATFRSIPGAYSARPKANISMLNLFMAGDWTDTDWPSTMESAVRSGAIVAKEVDCILAG